MDAQFEATVYLVINQFLHNLSDRCDIKSDQLWKLWKDMFNDFPKEQPVKKMLKKKETKPVVPEVKPVVSETKPGVPETKPGVPETKPGVPETKPVVPETKPIVSETKDIVPETKPVLPETKPIVSETKDIVPEVKPIVPESVVPDSVSVQNQVVSETKVIEPEIQDKKEKKHKVVTDGCQYIMTRGDRVGQECGKKKKGEQFCGLHMK